MCTLSSIKLFCVYMQTVVHHRVIVDAKLIYFPMIHIDVAMEYPFLILSIAMNMNIYTSFVMNFRAVV